MAQTGVMAPGVVVQPPSLPAPPPISLLTQGTTVDPSGDVERWAGGGGATWQSPFDGAVNLWQSWPESGHDPDGAKTTSSRTTEDGQVPAQVPMLAVLGITEGALQAFSDEQAGDSQEAQAQRAMAAALPRAIESELWTGAKVAAAGWVEQFRFANGGATVSALGASGGFLGALAAAEDAAAAQGFVDDFGGYMVHVSYSLFSRIVAKHTNLSVSPTGRVVRLPLGGVLVPELGADSATTVVVTPPVRIRLGRVEVNRSQYDLSNDRTVVVEQPFTIEGPVLDRPTIVTATADPTKEF